ncbi:MAG: YIP1 family protein [bacterium]|jgi:hypothetical protein|nr:YIP1 family protein [Bacillota bacterium]
MAQLLTYIGGVFSSPRSTLKKISSHRPLSSAIIVFAFTTFISSTAGLSTLPQDFPFGVGTFLPVMIIGSLIFGAFGWFFQAAIYHLFAEFLGGKGRALALFTTLPFTSLPGIILAPLGLIFRSLNLTFLSLPLSLALLVWVFLLQLWALQAVYELSGLRAAAAILLPFVAFTVAILLFGITLFTTTLPIIMQSLPTLSISL